MSTSTEVAKNITPSVDDIAKNQDASILYVLLFIVVFMVIIMTTIVIWGYRKLVSVIESNTQSSTKLTGLIDFFLTTVAGKIDNIPNRDEVKIYVDSFQTDHKEMKGHLNELLKNQMEIKAILRNKTNEK